MKGYATPKFKKLTSNSQINTCWKRVRRTTMDPTANLQEQRRLTAIINESIYASEISDAAVELAELAEALDQWISGGGFLPAQWRKES